MLRHDVGLPRTGTVAAAGATRQSRRGRGDNYIVIRVRNGQVAGRPTRTATETPGTTALIDLEATPLARGSVDCQGRHGSLVSEMWVALRLIPYPLEWPDSRAAPGSRKNF